MKTTPCQAHDKESEKQLTVVEWIEKTIGKNNMGNFLKNVIQQAKEMQKKQMFDFHIQVMKNGLEYENEQKWNDEFLPLILERAEETYNKTFKSE